MIGESDVGGRNGVLQHGRGGGPEVPGLAFVLVEVACLALVEVATGAAGVESGFSSHAEQGGESLAAPSLVALHLTSGQTECAFELFPVLVGGQAPSLGCYALRRRKGIEKSVFRHITSVFFFGLFEIGQSGFVARFGEFGVFEETNGERVVESGIEVLDVLTHFGHGHAAALELLEEAFDPGRDGRTVDLPSVVFRIVEEMIDHLDDGVVVGHDFGEIDGAFVPGVSTVQAVPVGRVTQIFGHPKLITDAHGAVDIIVARVGEVLSGLHRGEIILRRFRFVFAARCQAERCGGEESETERFEDRHNDGEMNG